MLKKNPKPGTLNLAPVKARPLVTLLHKSLGGLINRPGVRVPVPEGPSVEKSQGHNLDVRTFQEKVYVYLYIHLY